VVELINDWKNEPVARPTRGGAKPKPFSAKAILDAVAALDPDILNVYCFDDVQYPWVQVVFDKVITPAEAVRVGEALAKVVGDEFVYFNSLRPEAVYFVLDLPSDKPDLQAARYGTPLAEIKDAWNLAAKGAPGKSAGTRPSSAPKKRAAARR